MIHFMMLAFLACLFLSVYVLKSEASAFTAVIARHISASSPSSSRKADLSDEVYRGFIIRSSVAGALCSSLTHTLMVPLDVIKTKMQTDAVLSKLKTKEVHKVLSKSKSLTKGLKAVFFGYALQGAAKFGLYEYLKDKLVDMLQDVNIRYDEKTMRLPLYLTASAGAEVVATTLLCPMEVTKIAMITRKFPGSARLMSVIAVLIKEAGVGGLFKGLPLIMLRQVPYSCVKLVSYDYISEALTRQLNASDTMKEISTKKSNHKNSKGKKEQKKSIPVQLLSGVCAGVLATIVSQPADVLLSKICSPPVMMYGPRGDIVECLAVNSPTEVINVARNLGLKRLYKGLKPRAALVGSVTAMQFFIYENCKELLKSEGK
jgi:solute carrier family 25 (mitochondrial phosphate transporter), member 3